MLKPCEIAGCEIESGPPDKPIERDNFSLDLEVLVPRDPWTPPKGSVAFVAPITAHWLWKTLCFGALATTLPALTFQIGSVLDRRGMCAVDAPVTALMILSLLIDVVIVQQLFIVLWYGLRRRMSAFLDGGAIWQAGAGVLDPVIFLRPHPASGARVRMNLSQFRTGSTTCNVTTYDDG